MAFAASGSFQAAVLALFAALLAVAWANGAALRRVRAELEGERRRMALVLRATQSGVIDWDVAGARVDYSSHFKEMLGYPAHVDLSDRLAFFDWVHEEDRDRARSTFVQHLREGRDGGGEHLHPSIEYRLRRVDGSYLWVRGTGLSLRDADGRATRYISSVIDISEAKRHEAELSDQKEALKTQEQRLSLVVRAAQSGIIDWPAGSNRIYYSRRFKRMLGYPGDADSSGWPMFFELIHPEDKERVYAAFVEHLRKRTDEDETLHAAIEYRLRRADGSWVWVQGMGLSLRDSERRATRFLASITDITERRRQEEALRDQVKLTRDIIDANPNPLFLKDAQGRHLEVNAAWEALTGFKAADVIGRTTTEAFPAGTADAYVDQDRALLEGGESTRSDVVQVSRKTGQHTYLLAKSVLRRSDGTVRGLVGTVTDVTPLKRIEEELRASREEALQAAQAKSAFLATMSHEIRTPLNGVLGMAGLLAGTPLDDEQREYVDTIRVSGDALLTAINDILDYSKIESGRMELEDQPLEPVRAIEDSLGILGERARAKGIELIAEVDDPVPAWVRGDFGRLRQVLVNLVGNAVKFTEQGEVVVRVRVARAADGSAPPELEFSVADTGIGIPPDRREALFQAFTQADASTTRKYGGTGLGLAISKRLVEHMGGRLAVESSPGAGSTFSFTMPAPDCDRPPATAGMHQPAEISGRRILVVDDNATNLRILTRQLERWGATPVAVASGAAALALLERDAAFDAVVLDYHMPEMDGVMLAREIARRVPALPRLLLSSSMYRRAEEAEAGLFAVQLLKPVRQQQLHAALGRALAGSVPVPRAASPDAAQVAARFADLLPMRVLVVDDVEVNRRLAIALLRRLGYAADAAQSGTEAVARSGRYDLLLMDVQMPDLDGLEATRRIRAASGAHGPRIVAMTANALAGDREKCLAAGMDDYLPKPLDPEALRVALEKSAAHWIDWSRIESLKAYDDDGSLVRGVIEAFLADAPREGAAMRAALARGDAEGLGASAHALKGAALNIGATAVGSRCAEIEALAARGGLQDAARLLELLQVSVDGARHALAGRKYPFRLG